MDKQQQRYAENTADLLAALRDIDAAMGRIDWDSLPQTTRDKFRSLRAAVTYGRLVVAKVTKE